MDYIEVEILNWAKHQPRKDIKHPSWFAMSNRILEDSKLFGLSGDEWHALIYLFCQASQQNSAIVKINPSHAERVCGVKKKTMLSLLSRTRDACVTSAYAIRTDAYRDTTLHNTTHTTEQDTTVCTVVQNTPLPTEAAHLVGLLSNEVKNLYQDDESYVPRESVKAWAWCENNRRKAPKAVRGFRQFFSGWLERGWEKHRKSLPSSAPLSDAEAKERALFADEAQKASGQ